MKKEEVSRREKKEEKKQPREMIPSAVVGNSMHSTVIDSGVGTNKHESIPRSNRRFSAQFSYSRIVPNKYCILGIEIDMLIYNAKIL